VRELELNADLKSVNNLLDFLEKVFNGGGCMPIAVFICHAPSESLTLHG
jgi:hypothetical protein